MKPELHPRRRVLFAAAGLAWLAGCSKQGEATPPAAASTMASTAPSPRQAFESALRGTRFVVGQATSVRQALVFFDPQCPHLSLIHIYVYKRQSSAIRRPRCWPLPGWRAA